MGDIYIGPYKVGILIHSLYNFLKLIYPNRLICFYMNSNSSVQNCIIHINDSKQANINILENLYFIFSNTFKNLHYFSFRNLYLVD